jgi:hypothetical protein
MKKKRGSQEIFDRVKKNVTIRGEKRRIKMGSQEVTQN